MRNISQFSFRVRVRLYFTLYFILLISGKWNGMLETIIARVLFFVRSKSFFYYMNWGGNFQGDSVECLQTSPSPNDRCVPMQKLLLLNKHKELFMMT